MNDIQSGTVCVCVQKHITGYLRVFHVASISIQNIHYAHVGSNSADNLSFEVIGIPESKTDDEGESENGEEIIVQQESNSLVYEKVN